MFHFLKICGISYIMVVFLMPKLTFFQVSTGLAIELLNDSREVHRQDLQEDFMAVKNSRKCSGSVIY